MNIHIFTDGTPENVNALYTQLKKRVSYPVTIHCFSDTNENYLKYIDIIPPAKLNEYAWPEVFYIEKAGKNNYILSMPSNVFITTRFEGIVAMPIDTVRYDGVRGYGFFNITKPTEKDYIDYVSFEEYIKANRKEVLPMEGFFTIMPPWYDRNKDHESVLYETDLGLYTPLLPSKAHIELSDECTVKCPMCIQNSHSDPNKPSIFVRRKQLTLAQIQAMFTPEFLKESKMQHIELCGNVGEPTQARDFLQICEYFVSHGIVLSVHTNGMKKKDGFWTELAKTLTPTWSGVFFGIDGATASTHERIRPGAKFDTVLGHATEFINAGGMAFWKFVVFDQPREECFRAEELAKEMKFAQFMRIGDYPAEAAPLPKDIAAKIAEPVNDAKPVPRTKTERKTKTLASPVVKLETIKTRRAANAYIERRIQTGSSVRCRAKVENRFYMDAGGNVFPCLWTGMEILKGELSPHAESPFPYNWDLNNAKNYPLKEILTNEFFTRYMSYSLKLDPSAFCRRQCGV